MAVADFDFILTRNDLIRRAYKKIGVIGEGDTLSGEKLNDGVLALNEIVKDLQNDGLFLWQLVEGTFPTVANTKSYVVGTDPGLLGVDKCIVVNGASKVPIERLSWTDYLSLADPLLTGEPLSFASSGNPMSLYLYPVPNAVRTINWVGVSKLRDWDLAAGSGDIPARHQRGLMYLLASDLGEDYGVPGAELNRYLNLGQSLFERARKLILDKSDDEFIKGAFDG